jgi:uncharacterized secreted repeat protein (TIGR03808 family)
MSTLLLAATAICRQTASMRKLTAPNRRLFVAGLAGLAASLPLSARAQGGLVGDGTTDQTSALQAAIDGANGRLTLPAGRFRVSSLRLPSNILVEGVPGATWLITSSGMVASASGQSNIVLRDIGFSGDSGDAPLLGFEASTGIIVERCAFRDSPAIALGLRTSAATIRDCDFSGHGDAAIHSVDSLGVIVTGNRIEKCGNAGVRIWRSENGPDGSIVTNNRISTIDWRGGGNGQNGNGINVYLADQVIVADNHISDCAFTAVRLNTTHNCQVTGNLCFNSGEVAIFSEFGFSGSIVSDNVIDGAATGIAITNLDTNGQIATCAGNIVRNIFPRSAVNPDTRPIGILVEAEVALTGNLVANSPGAGIIAGWGPYLRNVALSGNVVVDGVGAVTLSGNLVSGASDGDIVGMRWTDISEPDLLGNAGRFPHLRVL